MIILNTKLVDGKLYSESSSENEQKLKKLMKELILEENTQGAGVRQPQQTKWVGVFGKKDNKTVKTFRL